MLHRGPGDGRKDHIRSASHTASVASFFVSRIDSIVDKAIDEKLKGGADPALPSQSPHGKIAVINAKAFVYQQYKRIL